MGTGASFRESMKPQISPLRKSLPSPFLSDITAAKIAPVPNFYSLPSPIFIQPRLAATRWCRA